MWRLLAFGLSVEDHQALKRQQWPWQWELVTLPNCSSLIDRMARGDHLIVVVDIDAVTDTDVSAILGAAASSGVRLAYRVSLTSRTASQIVACAHAGVPATVSLRGFDRIQESVTSLVTATHAPDGTASIVARLADCLDTESLAAATEACLVGRRAATVAGWAAVTRESTRSLERRVANTILPHPKRLLAWMLVLHTAWRVQQLGWPAKRAAADAGLSTARTLASRMQRVMGHDVATRRGRVPFLGMLELFVAELKGLVPIATATRQISRRRSTT